MNKQIIVIIFISEVSYHLHCKLLSVLDDRSNAMVQSMVEAFFFFIISINSTFPVNLAVLLIVNIPLLNSLPKLELLNALELKLTSTFIFFGGKHSSLALWNNNLSDSCALVQKRDSASIKLVRTPVCVFDPDLRCEFCVE